ncbi:MAG: MCE family protein [Candidatus Omnitrophota bacterium]|jgi:phospholipid/cholesterol/gamma-HCH transport system substrate-binding protein|nr:MAG: MCE family protein [Candidatus Omnitrophota bacterium]
MAVVSASEVKVGIMVVLAITLLVALTISVGDLQNLFSDAITIHIVTDKIAGLEPYAPVTFSGVRIGTVSDIRFDEELGKVVIDAAIDRNSPVATDSEIQFTAAGLLSPLYIDITGGSSDRKIKKLLKKGSSISDATNQPILSAEAIYIPAKTYYSFGDVMAMSGRITAALDKVEANLDALYPTLHQLGGFIENVSREADVILKEIDQLAVAASPKFLSILNHANTMIQDASAQMIPALQNVRVGAERIPALISQTGNGVTGLIDKTGGLIDAVSPEVSHTAETLRATLLDVKERMAVIEKNLSTLLTDVDQLVVDNREELDHMIRFLEQTSANLNDLSGQLAKNPWRILWKTEERKIPLRESPEWKPFKE